MDNEPGLGLSLAASLLGIVRPAGKAWHAEPESLAERPAPIDRTNLAQARSICWVGQISQMESISRNKNPPLPSDP